MSFEYLGVDIKSNTGDAINVQSNSLDIASEQTLSSVESRLNIIDGYGSLGFALECRTGSQKMDATRFTSAYFGGNGYCRGTDYQLLLDNNGMAPTASGIRIPPNEGSLWFNSTSANDNIAGTGAQILLFNYRDGSGVLHENNTLLMNGVTLVQTTQTDICNLVDCFVFQTGASGYNEGELLCYIDAGITLHGTALEQGNRFALPFFQIPQGSEFFFTKLNFRVPNPKSSVVVGFSVVANIPGLPEQHILQAPLGIGASIGDFDAVSTPGFPGGYVISLKARRLDSNNEERVVGTVQGLLYT